MRTSLARTHHAPIVLAYRGTAGCLTAASRATNPNPNPDPDPNPNPNPKQAAGPLPQERLRRRAAHPHRLRAKEGALVLRACRRMHTPCMHTPSASYQSCAAAAACRAMAVGARHARVRAVSARLHACLTWRAGAAERHPDQGAGRQRAQ
eukprot:scaffold121301_cov63-Phaeocystis_antarctica.AAC.4